MTCVDPATGPAAEAAPWSVIGGVIETELVVKKSRFLTYLAPVTSYEAASELVAQRRKAHWSARHHCTAIVLGTSGDSARSSDDGEPAGTAGMPMLQVLLRRQVTDLLAVTSRYFGGVLLGAGGLTRAYAGSVTQALDQAEVVARARREVVRLIGPVGQAGRIENAVRHWAAAHAASLLETDYGANFRIDLAIDQPDRSSLAELTAAGLGGIDLELLGTRMVELR